MERLENMTIKFWKNGNRVDALRKKMDETNNDFDRHRVHAHGLIDARLEDGEIDWEEVQRLKVEWDKRHGY